MKFIELAEEIKKLNPDSITAVIILLFEANKIDFIEVATQYVAQLEKQKKKNTGSIATLGLMLAMYCMTDNSPGGKNARKHLYESGAYGHNDGCVFGKQLDEEFNNETTVDK